MMQSESYKGNKTQDTLVLSLIVVPCKYVKYGRLAWYWNRACNSVRLLWLLG